MVQGSPLTFTAFGVKEIHRLKNKQETTDQIVGRYNVRLALDRRTEYNPSGLLVADYWEQQMVGDKNTGSHSRTNYRVRQRARTSRVERKPERRSTR